MKLGNGRWIWTWLPAITLAYNFHHFFARTYSLSGLPTFPYFSVVLISLIETSYSKYRRAVERLVPICLLSSTAVIPCVSLLFNKWVISSNVIGSIPFGNWLFAVLAGTEKPWIPRRRSISCCSIISRDVIKSCRCL